MIIRLKRVTFYRLAAAAVLLAAALLFSQSEVSLCGLDAGRFSLVESWGERGVFFTEGSSFGNPDKVFFNGHQYSDKPLPLSLAAAWVHRQVHNFTGITFAVQRRTAIKAVNTVFMFSSSLLLFLWTFNLLRRRRTGSLTAKFLLAPGALVLTITGSYATVLNNHLPAALALLGILIAAEKFTLKPAAAAAVIAGFAAGIAGVTELPLALPAGILAVLLIVRASPPGRRIFFPALTVAGGLTVLFFYLALNYYAYQDIRPLYLVPGGSYQTPVREWGEFRNYFLQVLIGQRGIFSYHWFLLPGFFVLLSGRRGGVGLCWGIFSVYVLLFYAVFTNEFGGWAYGFRYYIPLLPVFWYYSAGVFLERRPRWRPAVAAAAVLWGFTVMALGAYVPYCVTNEGVRTAPGDCTAEISCPVAGNLLFWLYRHAPDSAAYRLLSARYDREKLRQFLFWQYVNMDIPEPRLGVVSRYEAVKQVVGGGH